MYYPVQFISLGPGDPELVTIKALKALQHADVIFYPSTKNKKQETISRALDILSYLEVSADKLHSFNVPMSKDRSQALEAYKKVSNCIETEQKKGLRTAVVAEGDAGFYSSIHYIYDYLHEHNVKVEQIAGIPAFIACGAFVGLHITKQEEKLIVIPGVVTEDELLDYLKKGKSIVIMKVSQSQEAIKSTVRNQPEYKYHYFENIGVKDKEYYTSNNNDICNKDIPYFSLMIIKP